MLSEALKTIEEMAQAAVKFTPTTINPTNDPRTVLLVNPKDGTTTPLDVPPPAHAEVLHQIEDFTAFVNDQLPDEDAIVFAAFDQVTAIYDKDDRRDRATCNLDVHDQWTLIRTLAKGQSQYEQRSFLRLIRILLDGCMPDNRLYEITKNVKWTDNASGSSAIGHGTNTMGRALVQEVMGQEAFPEAIILNVPTWDVLGFRVAVRCAIEINADTKTFTITPFAGVVDEAEEQAMTWLTGRLRDALEHAKVYRGAVK